MLKQPAQTQVRSDLPERLHEARRRSDSLFGVVRREFLYQRPIPLRHRIVFYLGHLEAFDWNLICRDSAGMRPFHPQFDRLFAFGIDPTGSDLPSDQPVDWPSLEEIDRYNQRLREGVDGCLQDAIAPSPRGPQLDEAIFHVAIEHRLMHLETLAYMLHQLPPQQKMPQQLAAGPRDRQVIARMVEIPEGIATLGLARGNGAFGWDNEFEEHTVAVPAFRIDAFNVTHRQYLEFVQAGGYQDRSLWSQEDWEWKDRDGISHPPFWRRGGDGWLYQGMFAQFSLPLSWPVYVSHAEASAYARWKGKSLPTEAQFHRAAYGTREGRERSYPWGEDPPGPGRGNFNFQGWNSAPVGSYPAGDSTFGAADLLGNGWEWTCTLFGPFRGFEAFPFYRGYSADFFDGKHYVLKGGSVRTAACLLRRSFRNWFQPHYPYMYATFRCVEN